MNAAIFRFFFYFAPDSRRLAREKRNGKQRLKAPSGGFFCMRVLKKLSPTNQFTTDTMRKTMSHLAELVASARRPLARRQMLPR